MNNTLIYCLNRSGSTLLDQIVSALSSHGDLIYYSLNNPQHYAEISRDSWVKFMQLRQGCFGPIRIGEAEPSRPADFLLDRIVVQIRDPRDVLTSRFYAMCHVFPLGDDIYPTAAQKRVWLDAGIDAFVLEYASEVQAHYHATMDRLVKPAGACVLHYETLVTQPRIWLQQLLTALQVTELATEARAAIQRQLESELAITTENPAVHKRQITPGDHQRKLRSDTIVTLNRIFQQELAYFGYL